MTFVVGLAQIDRLVGDAGECRHPVRAPAALADGRVFGRRDESARVGGAVDHRGDDAFGAVIEHARDHDEIADRHAHQRRRAALAHRGDAGEHRAHVPQPVLTLERDHGKPFAADRLGDDRIGHAAPAAKHRLPRAQTAREAEARKSHDVRSRSICPP
jgi:hypothetical protein